MEPISSNLASSVSSRAARTPSRSLEPDRHGQGVSTFFDVSNFPSLASEVNKTYENRILLSITGYRSASLPVSKVPPSSRFMAMHRGPYQMEPDQEASEAS